MINETVIEKLTSTFPINLRENYGIKMVDEPISIGVPFAKGAIFNEKNAFILDDRGSILELQTKVLARWPNQSIKWLLFDFQASSAANADSIYELLVDTQRECPEPTNSIKVTRSHNAWIVNTGKTEFHLDELEFKPFIRVITSGAEIINPQHSAFILTNHKGEEFFPKISHISVETEGSLRATLKITGDFLSKKNEFFAKYTARLSFYANKSFVKCEFTLHNPKKAKHHGGLWDLGDKGSIFFKDLSLRLGVDENKNSCVTHWRVNSRNEYYKTAKPLKIYQDSSGGSNWMSPNHSNRFGKVSNSFCGYKVYENEKIIAEGKRAEPEVYIISGSKKISIALKDFWQNFPKSIGAEGNSIILGLFPKCYQDVFELQGGEQKTHIFYVDFDNTADDSLGLEWVNSPLRVSLEPKVYSESGVFGYLTLPHDDSNPGYKNSVNCAIEGNDTFLHKREVIDDYGWRNYGCLYADHEAVKSKDRESLVSHYNNQYDCIQALILQYARTGDPRWVCLFEPLAYHTIDIDTYHTDKDKAAYNGGLFWHTEHYTDARTSTHRTYSRDVLEYRNARFCGGGPGNEHNYTTGLLSMYFLTGNLAFKEAVIGLADWVINMDDGTKTLLRFLDKGPTGLASQSASEDYHGPGRGAGNSLNALIDAHALTQEEKYIVKAEELIQRCVHPKSDIRAQRLDEPEIRWFYLIFLQALGKYLDHKVEAGKTDYMYHYARESLIHYAEWMYENESLYKLVKDKLLIWTETWPAQDIRKSVVFDYAAKYSVGPARDKFLQKSEYFYNGSIEDLLSFETKTLLRPVILMMHFGVMHGYILAHIGEFKPVTSHSFDFGRPQAFVHQKARIKNKILWKNR